MDADKAALFDHEQEMHRRVDRLTVSLEAIANNGCGIPGHAVAVGCGSSAMAGFALRGHEVERCSAGRYWWHQHNEKPHPDPERAITMPGHSWPAGGAPREMEPDAYHSHPCTRCKGAGWLADGRAPADLTPDEARVQSKGRDERR